MAFYSKAKVDAQRDCGSLLDWSPGPHPCAAIAVFNHRRFYFVSQVSDEVFCENFFFCLQGRVALLFDWRGYGCE